MIGASVLVLAVAELLAGMVLAGGTCQMLIAVAALAGMAGMLPAAVALAVVLETVLPLWLLSVAP